MLSEKVQNALLDQINLEFSSSYSYLSMAAYCEYHEFSGCAKWLRVQAQEENSHAMKLYDFMLALGPALEEKDAKRYLKLCEKKFPRLRKATQSFAEIQPEVSTHMNYQMAVRSLQTAVEDVTALLKLPP